MGIIVSLFGGGTGRTDDPDPTTGLTSRDVYLVQTSWAPLRKDATKTGTTVLLNLFKKHPQYQDLFPFKGMPLDELKDSKKFHAHCNSVIYSLNSVVDNLKDAEVVVNLLTNVGKTHKPRKIPAQAFWDLNDIIIEILSTVTSAEALESWKKTLKVATTVMAKPLTDS